MCMNRESPTVSQHSQIHWESAPNGEKSQILLCIKVSTIQNQTRHPCEAQQSHEKKVKSLIRPWASGWHAPSSDENSGIRKWRVTAEKGQAPRVTPVSPSEEHRSHPSSQSEGKNECGAPNTLRSCNGNMLKVWISHARYLSQTPQRHIRWATTHFQSDIMEIHFMDITH